MKRHLFVIPLCAALLYGLSADARVVNRLGGADFTTISAALAAANPNETIEIDAAGNPYNEGSLFVGQSGITLTSRNGLAVLENTQLIVDNSNVTLDTIKLDGLHLFPVLVRVTGNAAGCTIRSCSMIRPASGPEDNGSTADDLSNAAELTNSGCAIEITGGGNVLIEDNDLRFPDDTTLLNQTCIVLGTNPQGAHSGVTIRGNQFAARTRNISCVGGWDNVTVEDNIFQRATVGIGRAGSGLLILTEPTQAGAVCHDWTITDNIFTYSNDSNVAVINAGIDNLVITGNNFVNGNDFDNISLLCMGGPVQITGNTFGDCGEYAVALANGDGQLPSAAVSGVLISGNHFVATDAGVSIGADVNTGILVENNQIDLIADNVAFNLTGGNSSAIIRSNHVTQGGSSSCVNLNSTGAAILDNYFRGGRRGVSFFGQSTFSFVSGNNLVHGNVVVESGLTGSANAIFGIGDWSTGGVTSYVASRNNSVVNNTIVLSAADGIYVSAPGYSIFNNISAFNVEQGVDVASGGTPAMLDFNLVFQNQGGNYAGATGGPHSLVANPQFVTFFGVSAGADFHLQPQSAARNAGSSNGLDRDFVTELGAYQDTEVDTGVLPSGWELYR